MVDRMPKILRVTWPKPCPFWGKLFTHPVGIPCAKLRTKSEVSSSCSFEDIFDCKLIPKILGVTWPRPRPFCGKLFANPLDCPIAKLHVKFVVCVSSSLKACSTVSQKSGATWPKPRRFWGKLFMHPVGIPYAKLRTKFEVSSSCSFEDILDNMPKF